MKKMMKQEENITLTERVDKDRRKRKEVGEEKTEEGAKRIGRGLEKEEIKYGGGEKEQQSVRGRKGCIILAWNVKLQTCSKVQERSDT